MTSDSHTVGGLNSCSMFLAMPTARSLMFSTSSSLPSFRMPLPDASSAGVHTGEAQSRSAPCRPLHEDDIDMLAPRSPATNPAPNPAELRNEIWGEIASFCSRDTVLNLRAVSRSLKRESDHAIPRIVVRGGARLRAFADADAFPHVQTLKLIKCADADLFYLATALVRHPRPQLCLEFDHGNFGITAQGWAALGMATFRRLQMRFGVMDIPDVLALHGLHCDMSITAYVSPAGMREMAKVPRISQFWPIRSVFDEAVARAFRDHPVTELTLTTCREVSSTSLQHVAENRTLRELNLDTAEAAFDAHAARAFAANETLETLAVWPPIHHFFDEYATAALAENRRLKTLSIPIPAGLHHLGRMTSLRTLHLQVPTESDSPPAPAIEARDAHALVHGLRLHTLRLSGLTFLGESLAVLVGGIKAYKLCLAEISIDAQSVAALVRNHAIAELELAIVHIDSRDAIALARHPSLLRFSIRTADDELDESFPLDAIQRVCAAWCQRGRLQSQLGGVLSGVSSLPYLIP